jgi:hypothetical protein
MEMKTCDHECVCKEYAINLSVTYDPCCVTCEHDTRTPKHHLITDTRTGKQYTTDLQQLCIDAGLSDRLTYCDIECLLTDGEMWYMLDECGNWAYLPSVYKVEDVR